MDAFKELNAVRRQLNEYLSDKDLTGSYQANVDNIQEQIDEQKGIFKVQMDNDAKVAAKPENVKAGILQGKVNKHLAEICFMDQVFVKAENGETVAKKIEAVAKANGCKLSVAKVVSYVLGA